MNNIKIVGILFQHGTDDFSLWEGFALTEEEVKTIMAIVEKHDTEGFSVRGTYKEVF